MPAHTLRVCAALCTVVMSIEAVVFRLYGAAATGGHPSTSVYGTTPQQRPKTTAFVLNLDSRPDRYSQMMSSWRNVTTVSLHRVSATPHYLSPDGNYTLSGCTMSFGRLVGDHFAAYPNIHVLLYMEDDAVPLRNFDERFSAILKYALAHLDEWHIINLGSFQAFASSFPAEEDYRANIFQVRSSHLLRSNVWGTTQSLLVNRAAIPAVERMLQFAKKYSYDDNRSLLDWLLSRDPELVTLIAVPSLTYQGPGISDNAPPRGLHVVHRDFRILYKQADSVLDEVMAAIIEEKYEAAQVHPSSTGGSTMLPYLDPSWTSFKVSDIIEHTRAKMRRGARLGAVHSLVLTTHAVDSKQQRLIEHSWGDVYGLKRDIHTCEGLQVGKLLVNNHKGRSAMDPQVHTCTMKACLAQRGNGTGQMSYVLLLDEYSVPRWDFERRLSSLLEVLESTAATWDYYVLGSGELSLQWCAGIVSECNLSVISGHLRSSSVPGASSMLVNCNRMSQAVRSDPHILLAAPAFNSMRPFYSSERGRALHLNKDIESWSRLMLQSKVWLDAQAAGATCQIRRDPGKVDARWQCEAGAAD